MRITTTPAATPTPIPPAATAVPAPPPPTGGGSTTPPPAAKPTISFKGAPKKLKLSRKRTFVLRFKATPGLKGTFKFTGITKKGTFKADAKGNVKLTIRTGKLRKRSLKLKITATSGALRATHAFTLVVPKR